MSVLKSELKRDVIFIPDLSTAIKLCKAPKPGMVWYGMVWYGMVQYAMPMLCYALGYDMMSLCGVLERFSSVSFARDK